MTRVPVTENILFGVDFSEALIGDKNIVNLATGGTLTRHMTGTTSDDGVIEHPTHGRCFKFDGKSWFTLEAVPQFSAYDFQLDLEFAPQAKSSSTIFSTGSFPGKGLRRGTLIGTEPDPDYISVWQYISEAQYRGTNAGGPNTLAMEKIRITQRNSVITVENLTRNLSKTLTPFSVPSDSFLCLGGTLNGTAMYTPFSGFIKSLRIRLL